MSGKSKNIIIGSRGSKLALCQTNIVADQLRQSCPDYKFEINTIKTTGDKITDVSLAKIGGKGLFTKELEQALLQHKIDLAVHSMKDLPTELPDGLSVASVPKRNNPRDVLITKKPAKLSELPEGACVGTSSLRRQAGLRSFRPDLHFKDLRGNLPTRIRKLFDDIEECDAIIVAAAGLERLGITGLFSEEISYEIMLPAVGQGALAIETRTDDTKIKQLVGVLNDTVTAIAVKAERCLLGGLGGGCQVPIGALATVTNSLLHLRSVVVSPDGKNIVPGEISGPCEQSAELGKRLAERLLKDGADKILEAIYG